MFGVLPGAYVTDAIRIHAVFGAFLIGVAMPHHSGRALLDLHRWLSPVIGFLAPIYFVGSGMTIDASELRTGDLVDLWLIFATAFAGKFLGGYGGARAVGVKPRDAAVIGIFMNTRGVVEIIQLTVGRDYELIDERLFALLAMMALVTTIFAPVALRAIPALAHRRRLDRAHDHCESSNIA